MRTARFLIGVSLPCAPALAFAQESGSGETVTGTGSDLRERLAVLAEGAMPLADFEQSDAARASWTAEVKRYAERSVELRSRCHEEIRKANRDTIADKAALCLRGDLMLEISHRRKQRDLLGEWPTDARASVISIDFWIEGANAVIDGIDAGVFTTIDTLKEAKANFHFLYRQPMFTDFALDRLASLEALTASLAFSVQTAVDTQNDPSSFLTQIVPCLEEANRRAVEVPVDPYVTPATRVRSTMSALRVCVDLIEDL